MISVYLIFDLSGKTSGYVGWTNKTPEKRLMGHINLAKRSGSGHISRALRKLNYQVSVKLLEVIHENESYQEAEKKWIKHYRDLGWNLWNMTDGGDGTLGHKKSQETKNKIRIAHLGKHFTREHRDNISQSKLGSHVSLTTREKISKNNARTMLGKKHSAEAREKIRLKHLGTRRSISSKEKQSRSLVLHYMTHDNPKGFLGKHHSTESNLKRSLSLKQYHANRNAT